MPRQGSGVRESRGRGRVSRGRGGGRGEVRVAVPADLQDAACAAQPRVAEEDDGEVGARGELGDEGMWGEGDCGGCVGDLLGDLGGGVEGVGDGEHDAEGLGGEGEDGDADGVGGEEEDDAAVTARAYLTV